MDLDTALTHLIAQTIERHPDIPSIALAVERDADRFAWSGGIVRGEPITTNAGEWPFRIASITKPFVATAIHLLIADGRLGLADPLSACCDATTVDLLEAEGYRTNTIQIAHLLSHTSGLIDHTHTARYTERLTTAPQHRWTRHEQIATAADGGGPLAAPGEVYAYSDTGYVILGGIIERVTGVDLARAVRDLIGFERLGLASTWWERLESAPADCPPPVTQRYDGRDAAAIDCSFDLYGGGGLISTLADLNRFFRLLLSGAILPAPALAAALATPAARPEPAEGGWRTHNYLLATMPTGRHWGQGHTGAWACAALRVPALGASIAVTLNSGSASAYAELRPLLAAVAALLEDGNGRV